MFTRRLILATAASTFLAACSTVQTQNLQSAGLKTFRRAYIEQPSSDEFQLVPALITELTDMGFVVVGRPFADPMETDLMVKVMSEGGWDMTRYLQSAQIQFVNAKTGQLVTSSSFYSRGAWLGVRDGRLKSLFNDIRQKNGYPPSKQFP